jgi:hypothetical protein
MSEDPEEELLRNMEKRLGIGPSDLGHDLSVVENYLRGCVETLAKVANQHPDLSAFEKTHIMALIRSFREANGHIKTLKSGDDGAAGVGVPAVPKAPVPVATEAAAMPISSDENKYDLDK